MLRSLVGSEMCIRDRYQRRVRGLTLAMSSATEYEAGQALPANNNTGDAPPEYTMVFGMSFEDPELAALVRKVLRISMLGAAFVVVSKIIQWETMKAVGNFEGSSTSVADLVLSIMIGLLVPACGYFGAQKKDKSLLK
eukprot:TRINITY_DN797_c0_g1_i5.p1 TRINITY_DN797_c0_g1~~TRINITY_DN797_c0_g1_i5.p1  ORF type:complete len:138 (+),score=48.40 TRINITY_DN797_c0_g1_i5:130-543(+)